VTALAPLFDKIRVLILVILTSDQTGEIVAAARALNRLLKANGTDHHELARHIGAETLNRDDMHQLYAAGYSDGQRDAENKRHGADPFCNVDGMPSWDEMAQFCQRHADRLRDHERKFVFDVSVRIVWREPSERQAKWLTSLFYRLGGRTP